MSENSIKNLTYGAVEDIDVTATNPCAYAGYCKKLGSDEICEIEVFINDKLVDTLKADKLVASVDKTYSCGNHCFMYEADEALFDKDNVIRFKHGGEDILGSPMDMKYTEHKLIHQLQTMEPITKIEDTDNENSIGFIATKENLEDEAFMEFLDELQKEIPDVRVKGFCLDAIQVKNIPNRYEKISLQSIEQIQALVKILYISHTTENFEILLLKLYKKLPKTFIAPIQTNNFTKQVSEQNNPTAFELMKTYHDKFGLTQDEIESANKHTPTLRIMLHLKNSKFENSFDYKAFQNYCVLKNIIENAKMILSDPIIIDNINNTKYLLKKFKS